MGWYWKPDMHDYNYERGFGNPLPIELPERRRNSTIDDLKAGIRLYKATLAEEQRKADKKKKEEKDKKKGFEMPKLTLGQTVAVLVITWPVIGMIERWMVHVVSP